MTKIFKYFIFVPFIVVILALSACQQRNLSSNSKAEQELPMSLQRKMAAMGIEKKAPIFIRLFKEESILEVWKKTSNGKYALVASYDICKWSGKLGPKYVEGDRQAPEGFYMITPAQMNPNSSYYLSFNIGFPNAFDRVNGRSGRHLMVHGACSSSGCYSMTDKNIAQIYAFARDAFRGGQHALQLQALPFRMTAANMARYRHDPNYAFWQNLKEGYDEFEKSKIPPIVNVCDKKYVFNLSNPNRRPISASDPCPLKAGASQLLENLNSNWINFLNFNSNKKSLPSIAGLKEALIVADWSARRARGERVSREPPSLSPASAELPDAPDISRQKNNLNRKDVNTYTLLNKTKHINARLILPKSGKNY